MLMPKKVAHRKWQVDRQSGARRVRPETRGITIAFGSYGLVATSQSRVTSNQIEAARKVLTRTVGKLAKVYIRIFPDRPFTRKPAEVGMGKGKGDLEGYVFDVRPGRVVFEVDGASVENMREGLRKAGTKLSVKTRIVSKEDQQKAKEASSAQATPTN
jgi:large subunit ribosomal protein L16